MTPTVPFTCIIQVLAEAIRRVVSEVPKVVNRVAMKVPRIRKFAKSAHIARGAKVILVDVTTIPRAQFKGLISSDAPEEALGLRRMVAESRRNTAR